MLPALTGNPPLLPGLHNALPLWQCPLLGPLLWPMSCPAEGLAMSFVSLDGLLTPLDSRTSVWRSSRWRWCSGKCSPATGWSRSRWHRWHRLSIGRFIFLQAPHLQLPTKKIVIFWSIFHAKNKRLYTVHPKWFKQESVSWIRIRSERIILPDRIYSQGLPMKIRISFHQNISWTIIFSTKFHYDFKKTENYDIYNAGEKVNKIYWHWYEFELNKICKKYSDFSTCERLGLGSWSGSASEFTILSESAPKRCRSTNIYRN